MAAALALFSAAPVAAQDVVLRLHQFLPSGATLPRHILVPWGERVAEASGGRLEIQHFDGMSLGGGPGDLLQQATDGAVDIAMTVVGFAPGRSPRTEVIELPFMMTDPVATGLAYQQLIEDELQQSDFADVHILAGWVHGPGVIHAKEPIHTLEDMQGKTLRAPTRIISQLLSELGAEAIGMPLPAAPEALSKGVIDGMVIPWEVVPSIKVHELTGHHTEFPGDHALYTTAFVLAMNKARYDSLPEDLRAALDAESGAKLAAFASGVMAEYDAPGREATLANGNEIHQMPPEEVARWKEAAQPVIDRWIADMEAKGIDGAALVEKARALIAEKEAM